MLKLEKTDVLWSFINRYLSALIEESFELRMNKDLYSRLIENLTVILQRVEIKDPVDLKRLEVLLISALDTLKKQSERKERHRLTILLPFTLLRRLKVAGLIQNEV